MEAEVTGSVVAALFGLDGFRALAAADAGGEAELLDETIVRVVPCPDCGAVARAKDRRAVWVRDLPIGGRPVVVCWHKRVWCHQARADRPRSGAAPRAARQPRASGSSWRPALWIRRILRRRADRLSERAWGRLRAGLVAGDPCGEVTAAWIIA